jgi:hypothetical protein
MYLMWFFHTDNLVLEGFEGAQPKRAIMASQAFSLNVTDHVSHSYTEELS